MSGAWDDALGSPIVFSTAAAFPYQFLMFSLRGCTNLKLTYLGPSPLYMSLSFPTSISLKTLGACFSDAGILFSACSLSWLGGRTVFDPTRSCLTLQVASPCLFL